MIFHHASFIIGQEYFLSARTIDALINYTHFFFPNYSHANNPDARRATAVPLQNKSFGSEELLPQLLHDHLFTALLVDAGLAAVPVAAGSGGRASCGGNLHFGS